MHRKNCLSLSKPIKLSVMKDSNYEKIVTGNFAVVKRIVMELNASSMDYYRYRKLKEPS